MRAGKNAQRWLCPTAVIADTTAVIPGLAAAQLARNDGEIMRHNDLALFPQLGLPI
jgi:hypothetical protein